MFIALLIGLNREVELPPVGPRCMSYLSFLSSHRKLLAFGLLTAWSSSFGQTFFISLFLPYFLSDFALDKGEFGFLYAVATTLGALCLPYLGCRIDRFDLRRYTTLTVVGMASSAFVVAVAPNVLLLAVGIIGLRLTGQGLMGHISQTLMAREFLADRGKALGIAGLGYPLGEAVLPLLCALALPFVPWTWAWIAVGLFALAVILPCALYLLRHTAAQTEPTAASAASVQSPTRKFRSPLKDPRLYKALPAILAPSFLLTGLFLYQATLSEERGWAPEWMAVAFAGFAVSRALISLGVGPLIDAYTASCLLPFYALPLGAGLALLYFGSSPWIVFPYLLLAGVTAGASGSIASALSAELFGIDEVGRVRSMIAMLGILSAAASPALMGALFQQGVTFDSMLLWAIGLVLAASSVAYAFSLGGHTALGPEVPRRRRSRFLAGDGL